MTAFWLASVAYGQVVFDLDDPLTLVGDAQILGVAVQVAPGTQNAVGAVWSAPWTVEPNLVVRTQFHLVMSGSASGGSGMTFALQSMGSGAIGTNGGQLGLQGISPSVALEFDTVSSAALSDPSANHVGLDLDGLLVSAGTVEAPFAMRGDAGFDVWIDYRHSTSELSVRLAQDGVRPVAPLAT